ncbi:FadR/GntR family transcriptional regulator [Mycobacterium sp.]|uniref:FadR/GntR family transcriptional regulator n=1 Tax=Mycobacterium sp. TaxID=1785 RepID=UPI003A87C84F
MVLQPVVRRSVPDAVFEQIAADVLSGEIRAGEALPSERKLAEMLEISRPAVREALKRLSAAGLVEVRHGDVTTVRDFRRHAGLDLLPQLLFRDGNLDGAVFRSILEVRSRSGPQIAELAAQRHGPGLAALLENSVRELESEDDPIAWQRHALEFWDHVVEGAGSIVFQLMYNVFRLTYEPALVALGATQTPELRQPAAYRELTEAICSGDSAEAKTVAEKMLEATNSTLMAELDRLGRT